MNESRTQAIGEHHGYPLEVFAGVSYQCPRLKLYGFETERKLRNAVDRKIRKANREMR